MVAAPFEPVDQLRMTGNPDHPCFCIPITCDSGECPQWCLIELQGELEVQEDTGSNPFPVGTLCQSSFVSIKKGVQCRDTPSFMYV